MVFAVEISAFIPSENISRVATLSSSPFPYAHTVLSVCAIHCSPVTTLPSWPVDGHTGILTNTNTNIQPLTYPNAVLLTNADL